MQVLFSSSFSLNINQSVMKKLELLLMVPTVSVLAAGTIVEKFHGNEFATTHIYGAWWFFVLLALIGIYAVYSIVKEKMWTKPYKLLLYSSVLFMLAGGALTAWTGKHGSVTLQPGVAVSEYKADNGTIVKLPVDLTLNGFEVVTYPGTHTPMDFVSHLSYKPADGESASVDVSMNNIFKYKGFRFYQEDYDDEGNSTLSVAHDPWGIAVTYTGYILMALGIVFLFVSRKSGFRRLLQSRAAAAVLLIAFLTMSGVASAAPRTLPKSTADKMGQMYVLYKGRVCPLQTLTKDFTTKLCGSARYEGLTSEQVFAGWMFYFSEWADEPMIKVKGDDVRGLLGIEGKRASFNDFVAHQDAFASQRSMGAQMPMGMGGAVKSKTMRAASEKYNLIQMLVGGKLAKEFPVRDSAGTVGWYAQNDDLPFATPDDDYFFIKKQLSYCQELVLKGDFDELEKVFEKTKSFQEKRAGSEVLPSSTTYNAERLYNRLTTGKWLAMLVVTLGLLFFALSLFRAKDKNRESNVDWVPFCVVAAVSVFLLTIFILRWIAGGHIPMAGGFDSMNLMSIAIGIIGLAISRRYRMAPSIALLTMGFCQLVAMMSGSNPPVTHLMPVLSSPLLTLHVTVIMISYALFFFVMVTGVAGLIVPSRSNEFRRLNLLMLYPAVALLSIGIVIGALWANISWGNYWSWDPKEVWALITLLVYLYPLVRCQQEGGFRSDRALHIYCVIAFFSVIITYFGVNLILGGIHSYN